MILLFTTILILKISSENWHRVENSHFEIYTEGRWQIPSLNMEMKKIYSLVNMNLSPFSPWMKKEKTKIYIFKDYESYLKSEFKPPHWSKGLCFHQKRTIVLYHRDSIEDLLSTIIHELTHLYFEDFFIRRMKTPPIWLNEGLAVYMESLYRGERSPWTNSLKSFPQDRVMRFDIFIKTDPHKLPTEQDIAFWYLQSYGMVRYLLSFGRAAFYRFNLELLQNKEIEKALWEIYRISNWEIFEKRWTSWLSRIKDNNQFNFKPFKTIEFKRFN